MYAVIGKMRYEYTKELQHLKDSVIELLSSYVFQLILKTQAGVSSFTYTDSKFFEQIDTLMDEQTKFVFLSKISDVTRIYDEKYT